MITRRLLFMLVVLALMASGLQAALVNVSGSESSRVYAAEPDTNKSATKLDVRKDAGIKSWLKFDIAPYIDNYLVSGSRNSDIIIVEAVLKLYMSDARSLDRHISVSGVNDNVLDNIGWTTTSITFNNAPGNDTSSYTDVDPDKTTYLGLLLMPGVANELKDLDVTAFVNLDSDGIVQFALHQQTEAAALTRFWSTTGTEEYRPVLEVTYSVIPEPMTVLLLGLGGLVLRKTKS